MREIAQERRALRRVHHLGVELHAINAALVVGDRGKGRALAYRHGAEARRQRLDPVAMAHPHLLAIALGPEPREERAIIDDLDEGAAEFAVIRGRDLAAELSADRLLAIADAENRHAQREDFVGHARAERLDDRGRTAREDHRLWAEGCDLVIAQIEGMDLAIDAALAQAPCDELRHLAAEIEDEDAVLGGGHGASSAGAGVFARARRSMTATKNPSVPWRAGLRRSPSPRAGHSPSKVSAQIAAIGSAAKSAWLARNLSIWSSSSSRSSEQVA